MRIMMVLVVVVAATACGGSPSATTTTSSTTSASSATVIDGVEQVTVAAGDSTVTVRQGDVIRVPWSVLDIAILEIADSRCPSVFGGDEVCVWEGEVRTTLEFRSDGGAVERRELTGLHAGKGQTVYGDEHWTWFDLVEVGAEELDADGNLTLFISARD